MEGEVIVLDEDAVEESHAMVHAATARDGILVEDPQAGDGFPRIDDSSASTFDPIHVLARERGNTAHPLEQIEGGTFPDEDRSGGAADFSEWCTDCGRRAVDYKLFELNSGIDEPHDFLHDRHSGYNERLLGCVPGLGARIRGYGGMGRNVAAADILA
jgi:hypothetical protein